MMKIVHSLVFACAALVSLALPASAQAPVQTAMGFCTLGSISAAVGITSTNCVFASFTGAIAGNQMAVSAVASGHILPGQPVVGSNVPAGMYVVSASKNPITGLTGTYTVSIRLTTPITSESMTTAGAPPFAKYATFCANTQAVNYRDDMTAPTVGATGGDIIPAGQCIPYNAANAPYSANGAFSNVQFIEQTATGTLNIKFYQ